MASQTTVLLSLAALVCLAALALAAPQRFDEDGGMIFRDRRAAPRYSSFRRGAATRNAPVIAEPESSEADEAEEVQSDEEQEEPIAPVKPVRQSRGRPQTAPKPPQSEEQDEEDDQEEKGAAPPAYGAKKGGGATAIATTYSRGKGASGNSHATAYGGRFSGGQFRQRHN